MAERIETRRHFLKSLACGAAALTTGCHALSKNSKPSRPNFVLIIGDDISVDDFGCYGHPFRTRVTTLPAITTRYNGWTAMLGWWLEN